MKYIVRLHKWYSDADEYSFSSIKDRDKFLDNLPAFYKAHPNFISYDVRKV